MSGNHVKLFLTVLVAVGFVAFQPGESTAGGCKISSGGSSSGSGSGGGCGWTMTTKYDKCDSSGSHNHHHHHGKDLPMKQGSCDKTRDNTTDTSAGGSSSGGGLSTRERVAWREIVLTDSGSMSYSAVDVVTSTTTTTTSSTITSTTMMGGGGGGGMGMGM
jgi:hypothetical protein